jgi:hypothetical protein
MHPRSNPRRGALLVTALACTITVASPTSPALAYSGTSAAQYADAHWNSRTDNYPEFGNDCTNFLSQALHDESGGGMAYVNQYGSATDDHNWWAAWKPQQGFRWSHSWSVAADFYRFLRLHSPGGEPAGSARNLKDQQAKYTPDSVVTGDVLFYDWESDNSIDHVGIQVGYGQDPNSSYNGNYQDQHTTDRYHAFWSLLPYNSQWSTTTIYFMHVSPSN